MSLKPELTFPKAARLIARRSWFVLLCAIAAAAGAYRLAKPPHHAFVAKTRLHVVDTTVSYDSRGEAIPTTVIPRNVGDVRVDNFLLPGAADAAVHKVQVPGLTALELLDRLQVAPLSTTDVDISFRAPTAQRAVDVLNAYVNAYVAGKRSQQERALNAARALMQRQAKALAPIPGGIPPDNATTARIQDIGAHIDGLAIAAELLPQRITATGVTEVRTKKSGLPRAAATLAGLFAGLGAGILFVLLLARFDRRIRSVTDLRLPGTRVVEVDSAGNPQSLRRLWAELELTEVELGRDVSSVSVTSPTSRENAAGVAVRLAEVFASAGTSTLILDAHEDGSQSVDLADPEGEIQTVPVSPNLVRVAEPMSPTSVSRLLSERRRSGQVVVLACPPVEDNPEALLLAANADVVVLVLRRSHSSWSRLEDALATLQSAARRPVVVCFDRALLSGSRVDSDTPLVEHVLPGAADEVDVPVRL